MIGNLLKTYVDHRIERLRIGQKRAHELCNSRGGHQTQHQPEESGHALPFNQPEAATSLGLFKSASGHQSKPKNGAGASPRRSRTNRLRGGSR